MKLTSLYKDIILEAVSRNQIISAINNRNVCTIYYEGDTINNPGYREIEPYVYGLSKRENPVIRANSGDIFEEPKPLYNPNGDRDMTRIYTQAKF